MDTLLIDLKVDELKIRLSMLCRIVNYRFLIIVTKPDRVSEWNVCIVKCSVAIYQRECIVQSIKLIST